jgi:hypothetical protein
MDLHIRIPYRAPEEIKTYSTERDPVALYLPPQYPTANPPWSTTRERT